LFDLGCVTVVRLLPFYVVVCSRCIFTFVHVVLRCLHLVCFDVVRLPYVVSRTYVRLRFCSPFTLSFDFRSTLFTTTALLSACYVRLISVTYVALPFVLHTVAFGFVRLRFATFTRLRLHIRTRSAVRLRFLHVDSFTFLFVTFSPHVTYARVFAHCTVWVVVVLLRLPTVAAVTRTRVTVTHAHRSVSVWLVAFVSVHVFCTAQFSFVTHVYVGFTPLSTFCLRYVTGLRYRFGFAVTRTVPRLVAAHARVLGLVRLYTIHILIWLVYVWLRAWLRFTAILVRTAHGLPLHVRFTRTVTRFCRVTLVTRHRVATLRVYGFIRFCVSPRTVSFSHGYVCWYVCVPLHIFGYGSLVTVTDTHTPPRVYVYVPVYVTHTFYRLMVVLRLRYTLRSR